MITANELRPAQQRILAYREGRMAIAAAPGAGKTFILTRLATELVIEAGVRPDQILILTYMRAAAQEFSTRIRAELARHHIAARGLQASTIHAFCQGLMRREASRWGEAEGTSEMVVLAEPERRAVLRAGLRAWLADKDHARGFADGKDGEEASRDALDAAAKTISLAKQLGLGLIDLSKRLAVLPEISFIAAHYAAYQAARSVLDFDDLILGAIKLLESRQDVLDALRRRIRFVFEDEAQDSTPAQNRLLDLLAGDNGNLVRVGDPNQAITSSFTYTDPRLFAAFCASASFVPMNESSRSAQPILDMANRLVDLVSGHPDPEIRQAFNGQHALAATAGPRNPEPGRLGWTEFPTKPAEIEGVIRQVLRHGRENPGDVCAILCHSNVMIHGNDKGPGYLAKALEMGLDVFESSDETGEAGSLLETFDAALGVLEAPMEGLDRLVLATLRGVVTASGSRLVWPKALDEALRTFEVKRFLTPRIQLKPARPCGVNEADYLHLIRTGEGLRELLGLRQLPIEDLAGAMAGILFPDQEAPLQLAFKLSSFARREAFDNRDAALPPSAPPSLLRRAIARVRAEGKVDKLIPAAAASQPPGPGQVVISTLHSAKGREFDAVWIPTCGYYYSPQSYFPWRLGEARPPTHSVLFAQRAVRGLAPDPAAATLAHQREIIAERLRLLYVGITRARRHLALSTYAYRQPAAPAHVTELARACGS